MRLPRSRVCELFDVEVALIQAAIWPATTPELVAAVNRSGGIGSIGAVFGSAEAIADEIERTKALTDRPFIVNHVVPLLDEEAFLATLEARPAVVSFALGPPVGLVERAHDAGAKVVHQVHTVKQGIEAAALGVDALIAQGSEAGGQGMVAGVSTMALVPQLVDAVDVPIIASGGIADGRGFAAALALGAAGINVGTSFLAAEEAAVSYEWRSMLIKSDSEDAVRFEAWEQLFPPRSGGYRVVPRALPTSFMSDIASGDLDPEGARSDLMQAIRDRSPGALVPFTGQTVGLVREVLPAAEIVRRFVTEAEAALSRLVAERQD